MAIRMKVRIRVGPHAGKIFEGEYKYMGVGKEGVTIPELNDEFFWAGSSLQLNNLDKTANRLDAEYENLWVPYYKKDNGDGEICVGDMVLFVSEKAIKYGQVDKIHPRGLSGGISTISKVTIKEFVTNCKYTYEHLHGIVKMENVGEILRKFEKATV